ncbi:hypothetical protein IHN63_07980 [Deinococcus sp. 6YEL10]|uniref:hypothetical protein n=1 Tax=Deinococcus sp. 6YEL10 TaxID=2745870 RepID=UPI001E4633DF|nr:hypothetical protein [Deinococcus sp. 6YEL10]MCD0161244.1 hypothetical protein [Deinococcus sp. 6YEL10]
MAPRKQTARPATSDEILAGLNDRMTRLETRVDAALTRLEAFLFDPPAGPPGPPGEPGPQGEAGATPDLTALTDDLQARLDHLEDLERQMRTRVHQVADESEARVQRAITQVNLLTRKGSDQ